MVFLVVMLIGGIALLIGGQMWALTGSTMAALCVGGMVSLGLGYGCKHIARGRKNMRFFGEVDAVVRESDFTVRVRGRNAVQNRIDQTTGGQSVRLAETVRALMRGKNQEN